MGKLTSVVIGLALATMSQAVNAQTTNISIEGTANDDLGRQLVARIRQKVAQSPLMTYVANDNLGSLRLRITTLNPDENATSQNLTIYAEIIVVHPRNGGLETYLDNSVGTCGRNKIDQCADGIYADLDNWIAQINKIPSK